MVPNKYKIELINAANSAFIPLALHYIKLYAMKDPFVESTAQIDIVEPKDLLDIDEIVHGIIKRSPKLIGFSMYVWCSKRVIEICRRVKKEKPEIIIVLGGPDVTPIAEKFLQEHHAYVDFLVLGEGELTFHHLISELIKNPNLDNESLSQIQGIAFYRDHQYFAPPRRHIIENLDLIPSPYISGSIDLKTEKRMILLETYRGCPFTCSFCFYPKDFGKLIHNFSLERVEAEIKYIFENGATSLLLMDPTFNIPPKRALEILKFVEKYIKNSEVTIGTELRVDLLDEEIIDYLVKANFKIVELGLQSSNPDVLKLIHRTQNLKQIKKNVEILKNKGIKLVTQTIAGLPGESFQSFLDSIDYCVELKAKKLEIYRLQLLPGTPMYNQAKELGLEFDHEAPRNIIKTPQMSAHEINKAMEITSLIHSFYNEGLLRQTYLSLSKKINIPVSQLLSLHLKWIKSNDLSKFNQLIEEWLIDKKKFNHKNYQEHQAIFKIYIYDFFRELIKNQKHEELLELVLECIKLDFFMSRNYFKQLQKMSVLKPSSKMIPSNFLKIVDFDYEPSSFLELKKSEKKKASVLFIPDISNSFQTTNNGYVFEVQAFMEVDEKSLDVLKSKNWLEHSDFNQFKAMELN